MDLVDNSAVRSAVAQFAARPEAATYRDVLRACLQGDLLLDATGSTMISTADGNGLAEGSVLSIHEGIGTDGGRALYAFTRQEEAQKMRPDVAAVTIGQPATRLLEFAVREGYAWLYIDPAGPTCALGLDDLKVALRAPRNEPVKAALTLTDPVAQRQAVLDALANGGLLLRAATVEADGSTMVRTTVGPDGKTRLLAFTSEMEVAARYATFSFIVSPIEEILRNAVAGSMPGLLINPAGPWIQLEPREIRSVAAQLNELDG